MTAAIKRLSVLVVGLALSSACLFAESKDSPNNVLTGAVTCSLRANHQFTCGRNETLQSCTLRCVQLQNASYVLLVHDRPYVLEGDASVLEHFAGGKATVAARSMAIVFRSGSSPGRTRWLSH